MYLNKRGGEGVPVIYTLIGDVNYMQFKATALQGRYTALQNKATLRYRAFYPLQALQPLQDIIQ